MTRSTGFNVQRQLVGGVGARDTTQERRGGYQGGTAPTLQRAVVVDVITDPNALTPEELDKLEDSVNNPETVGTMPYNSIVGRIVSHEHDLGDPTPHIFYPFFSSHFQLPVKPGEQVFIIYEDFSQSGNILGYWMTRAPAARQIEDVNYTHYDRLYDPTNNLRNLTSSQRSALTGSAPNFPNGAGTPESYSLKPATDSTTNPFEDIVTNATASIISQFEAVPRQRKRPGDFALFGSNNAAIIIGRDRTGPLVPVTGSEGKDVLAKAGTIDLVAGLGAPRKPPGPDDDPTAGNHNPTAARVIANTRSKQEVDKVPFKKQGKPNNPTEGDPDFKRDLSRVYISMKTKGDENFGINFGNDNDNADGIFTNTDAKYGDKIEDLPAGENAGQPFAVIKSEHVRIIAKGKDEDNGPDASGDIRIIKEGKVADDPKDFAMLVMAKDGRVMLHGKKVYINFNDADDGRILLGCKSDTEGDADPVVLYSKLKITLNLIVDMMYQLAGKTADQFKGISDGISAPNAAGPFSPIPGLIGVKVKSSLGSSNLNTFRDTKIKPLKSTESDDMKVADTRSKNVFMKKDNQS
jgi:hypothetical protein